MAGESTVAANGGNGVQGIDGAQPSDPFSDAAIQESLRGFEAGYSEGDLTAEPDDVSVRLDDGEEPEGDDELSPFQHQVEALQGDLQQQRQLNWQLAQAMQYLHKQLGEQRAIDEQFARSVVKESQPKIDEDPGAFFSDLFSRQEQTIIAKLQAQQQQQQQVQQQQQAIATVDNSFRDGESKYPGFESAMAHMAHWSMQAATAMGIPQTEVQQRVQAGIYQRGLEALARGQDPAEYLYQLSMHHYGFDASEYFAQLEGAAEPEPQPAPRYQQKHQRALEQKERRQPQARRPASQLTRDAVLAMTPKEVAGYTETDEGWQALLAPFAT